MGLLEPTSVFLLIVVLPTSAGISIVENSTTTKQVSIPGLGDVVGVIHPGPIGGDPVSVYKGISYAEPPTGPLRFAKPQSKRPWLNALDATEYGPICIPGQFGTGMYRDDRAPDELRTAVRQSEDCLSLNIFVPDAAVASEGPLPVMVWIHGGGFVVGAGSNHDGSVLAEVGPVLVVTFNYRLGVLGFFSTGDDAAPGNYGLWDQRLAIIWVRDHIGSFGGDPAKITLFGFSAGAKGIAIQTATPVNDRSLFQRAIMESGAMDDSSANSPETAALRSRQLGELLNCDSSGGDSSVLVDCAREASAETLVEASNQIPVDFVDFSPFYPTIDGEFFPDYIPDLLDAGHLGRYDFLTGVNSDEGTLARSSGRIPASIDSGEELAALLEELLVATFCRCQNALELAEAAAFVYTSERGATISDGRLNRGAFLDAFADMVYTAPCLNNARHHAQANLTSRGRSFLYLFPYRAEDEPSPEPDIITGAGHGDEVPYVFGDYLRDNPGTEKGNLSALMIRYWTNFARNGDPNEHSVIPHWPSYNLENESYAILQPEVDTGRRLQAGQVGLWLDYLPSIAKPTDPNTCSLDVPVRRETAQNPDRGKTVRVASEAGETLGTVIGDVRAVDPGIGGGKEVAEFLGIPYAEPPVGELRFQSPKLALSWKEEELPLDLRGKIPLACPQDTTRDPRMVRLGFDATSEDCLTLNIHAPLDEPGHDGARLHVVVFIHSGDLVSGTSSVYDAGFLASRTEAVVVCINYRLGALGFLSSEDESARGNYGLQDALAALQWVHMFIGSFGGDPTRVTLIGHGAGSVVAHLLVLTDSSAGLFQRVVSMSGTALTPYLQNPVQPGPLERTRALAEKLGCSSEKTDEMISCLRDKPARDLIENTPHFPFSFSFPIVTDGSLLKQSPPEILKSGNFQKVDYVIGMARDEQAALAADMFSREAWTGCPNETEVEHLIESTCRDSFPDAELVSLSLAAEYVDNGRHSPEDKDCPTRGFLRRFLHDYLTAAPTIQAAVHHESAGAAVSLYLFDHLPVNRYRAQLPEWTGPAFGDDLQFLFGDPYSSRTHDELNMSYSLKDKKTSLQLTDLISNFIRNGSSGESVSGVAWPSFESSGFPYLSVGPCPEDRSGLDEGWRHKLRFWSALLATTSTQPSPTLSLFTCSGPIGSDCLVSSLGREMSLDVAGALIETLLGVSVAVFGLLVIVVFVACVRACRMQKEYQEDEVEMNAHL